MSSAQAPVLLLEQGSRLLVDAALELPSGVYHVTRDGDRATNARFKRLSGWAPTRWPPGHAARGSAPDIGQSVMPPSSAIVCPVRYAPASEARYSASSPTSRGAPARPSGIVPLARSIAAR